MSALHGFAYAQARAQARHGERLRETDWQGLEAARSTDIYLDRVRRTCLHRFTERLDARMDAHAIERGLRAAWRSYVLEIADWMASTACDERMSRWWLRSFWTCLRMAVAWRTVLDKNQRRKAGVEERGASGDAGAGADG